MATPQLQQLTIQILARLEFTEELVSREERDAAKWELCSNLGGCD